MELGTILSVARALLTVLQCSELKDLCSILGYRLELENLERTVNIVKAVLVDAELKQLQVDLLPQAQLYIDELKDVVFDADDLLDEFVTLARRQKHLKGNMVSKKVRLLVYQLKSFPAVHKMSQAVKRIRRRLDAIAYNHSQFGFKLDCQPTRRRREETCSYVYAQDVVGREVDVEKIVIKLLDTNVDQHVSCLPIVGIGGLGKTTLAQLIYNDPRIKENFSLRLWTCVSDQDQHYLDVKAVLCKLLHSVTCGNHEHLAMEPLQRQLQEQLHGKKYFLVLDDVWNEDRLQWLELVKFFMSGMRGSWIVLTTRSEKTATIVGGNHTYKLKGLSEEVSWRLFEMTAFGHNYDETHYPDLVKIGQGIVRRCANVPLAIRVVGTLLYNQGKEKWLSFQKIGLGGLKHGQNCGIEPILKLSYHHLDSPLKSCFSYCALFPKDHIIEKEKLIGLWMAQDYIVPLQKGQSVEDAGNEYFLILVRRCFFQEIKTDEYGEIVSCKIHDLMHDIAQEVVGNEICATNSMMGSLNTKTRHLSYLSMDEDMGYMAHSFTRTKIRTYLRVGWRQQCIHVDMLLRKWVYLRVLDLSNSWFKSLPNSLGNLVHLRYLDLSGNSEIDLLPSSIKNLQNLQTLNLQHWWRLKELPKDLSLLVKLRVLDIDGCREINGMPRGMGKLTCLRKLPMFVVGDKNSSMTKSIVHQLEDLKALVNLKGQLEIKILKNTEYVAKTVRGGYISNTEHLSRAKIEFPLEVEVGNIMEDTQQESLLEDLQPHPNLRELELHNYTGKRMPSWAMEENLTSFLPHLVRIELDSCQGLLHLASFGKLQNLKSLTIKHLKNLEYIESSSQGNNNVWSRASKAETFFPSLEQLELKSLPKLKGWCDEIVGLSPSFPRLSKLSIRECPDLECIPPCPAVEELRLLGNFNEKFCIMSTVELGSSKLRWVEAWNMRCLTSILPVEAFQSQRLEIFCRWKIFNATTGDILG